MKLISWNVNGLRACMQKGFMDFFNEIDADIFCLQETKMQQGQLELELPDYHQYWNSAEKKGYSGTAMFTKRDIIKLIIPMIIQNVLTILVGTADSMMVSSAGEAAVSGVSLVGSVDSLS